MSLVGKIPSIAVDLRNGDNLKINILKKLQKQQKVILFWYPKDFVCIQLLQI
jgi:peroxiredoxin